MGTKGTVTEKEIVIVKGTDLKSEKELALTSDKLVKSYSSLTVIDKLTMEKAGQAVIEIDKLRKRIVGYWKEPKESASRTHKLIVAKEKEMTGALDDIRSKITGKITNFLEIEEEKRQLKIQQDLERANKEAEKIQKKAEKAESEGKSEKADELKSKAMDIVNNVELPEQEKSVRLDSGGMITKTETLEISIVNKEAFLKFICSMPVVPVGLVEIKEGELKRFIKANAYESFAGLQIRKGISTGFRQ